MCGISGLYYKSSLHHSNALLAVNNMMNYMFLRGPDSGAVWSDQNLVLGHRRLAILDLDSRANQPMISSCGRFVIVFNGEIYNFLELRTALEKESFFFKTCSDTEVLLALFARYGEKMLSMLRGMFAFAIWDNVEREIFLARDPYGIKPLYYSNINDGFIFASQVKAILSSCLLAKQLEPAGVAGFYLTGSVPEPWTFYKGIFSLPAGHWMRVKDGISGPITSWFDIKSAWQAQNKKLSSQDLISIIRDCVEDSVRAHLVADVPACVFLSGGIDSAVVAAMAKESGADIEGITVSFDEYVGRSEDEGPIASSIAKYYGLKHFVRHVNKVEFMSDLPKILKAMDQPSVDGINTWFASKAAAERGYKVALSGIGGDELFCGYATFKTVPNLALLGKVMNFIPGMKKAMGAACKIAAQLRHHPKFLALHEYVDTVENAYFFSRCLFLPSELNGLMGVQFAQEGLGRLGNFSPQLPFFGKLNAEAIVGQLESTYYLRNQLLRDSDWASMAHSLELRTPLVDKNLLQVLAPYSHKFIGGRGKKLLAISPNRPIPDSVISRPKTGFSTPMRQWLEKGSAINKFFPPISNNSKIPWARSWAISIVSELSK